ncbi:S41 family peptidase [Halocola ammonii]
MSKNMKFSLQKNKLRKAIVIAMIGVVSVGSYSFADSYFELSKNLEIFTSLYKNLNIYYVDETEPGELMKTGVDAMLNSLDPYTTYYPESKIEDYRFMTTGEYGGIGALIQSIEGKITVAEPYEGFPAEKAGLRAGDVIVTIDGRPIEGKEQSEVSDLLKGQSGTEVKLEVNRPGKEELMTFTLNREEVKIPDVPYSGMLDNETGYIKLTSFTQTASRDVKKAYRELEEAGMKKLVFDLRGNGGGLLREAVNIVNMFVPKGTTVVNTKGKIEEWNRTHETLSDPIAPDIPVTVLVNGGSASASEIVSGALQDLDRAVVIGEETFGKGLVQQTKDLSYNAKLKLTVAKYYIPSGRCIQKLDYSHRAENGQVEEVPDSLIQEFETKGGRPVFDGRGIRPDVYVEDEQLSNILNGLIAEQVVFNYATKFHRENSEIAASEEFELSDSQYKEFVAYALKQEFEYNTATEKMYEELKRTAEREKYIEGAEVEFEKLLAKIEPKKEEDLMKFRSQIQEYLENEIVSRYYYQTGRVKHSLDRDPYISTAMKTLRDGYSDILAGTAAKN